MEHAEQRLPFLNPSSPNINFNRHEMRQGQHDCFRLFQERKERKKRDHKN